MPCMDAATDAAQNGALHDDLDRHAHGQPWLHAGSDANALIMAASVGCSLALRSDLESRAYLSAGNSHGSAAARRQGECGCGGCWECLGRQARSGVECGLRRTVSSGWRGDGALPRNPGRGRSVGNKA
jgi:hypothetical protein